MNSIDRERPPWTQLLNEQSAAALLCSIKLGFGLLVLRIWIGGTLLLNHGWSKLTNFSGMSNRFGDPLHIGHPASLALTVFAEVICSLLLIVGFASRFAALIIIIELGVAFVLVHHMKLSGPGNGELAFIYLAGLVRIFLAGAGRFSLDGKI